MNIYTVYNLQAAAYNYMAVPQYLLTIWVGFARRDILNQGHV